MNIFRDTTAKSWLPLLSLFAVVAYVLPLLISYLLYDTHSGPDKIFWRIVIFWRTFGIGLHILSALFALCAGVIWTRCFRQIPRFAFTRLAIFTGGATLCVLALLFYGWSGLFH
jgi:hypothetical protein